jgi:hypothetical protein
MDLLAIHPDRRRGADAQANALSQDFHHDAEDLPVKHDLSTDTCEH